MFKSDGLNFDDLREFKWEFAREAEKHFLERDPDFFVDMTVASQFLRENGQKSLYNALDSDVEIQAEDLFYDKSLEGEMGDRLDNLFKHYRDKIDDVFLSMSYIKENEAEKDPAEENFMEGFEKAAEGETGRKVFDTVVSRAKESKDAPEGFWGQFASLSGKDQLKVVGKTLWGMFKVLVGASGVGGTSYNAENSLRDILQILQKQNEHTDHLMENMLSVMNNMRVKDAVDFHKEHGFVENEEEKGEETGAPGRAAEGAGEAEVQSGSGEGKDFIKRGKVPFDFEAAGIPAELLKADRPWMHGWSKDEKYAKEFDDFCLMHANILADCISRGATQEGFHRLKDGQSGNMYDATVDYLYESMHESAFEGVDLINNNKQIAAVELYNYCCKNAVSDSRYATALSDKDIFKTVVDEIAARMDKDVYCSFEEAASVTFPDFGFTVPDKKQYYDYETSDNAAIYQHLGSQYIEGLKSQIADIVKSPDYPDNLAPEKQKELSDLQDSALFAEHAVTYLCDYGADFGGYALIEDDFAGKDAFAKLVAELKAEYDKPEYEGGPLACVHAVLLKREQDNLDRWNDVTHVKDVVTYKPQFEKTKEEEKEMKSSEDFVKAKDDFVEKVMKGEYEKHDARDGEKVPWDVEAAFAKSRFVDKVNKGEYEKHDARDGEKVPWDVEAAFAKFAKAHFVDKVMKGEYEKHDARDAEKVPWDSEAALLGIIDRFKEGGVTLDEHGSVQIDPSKLEQDQLMDIAHYYDHECYVSDVKSTFEDIAITEDGLFDEKSRMSKYDEFVSISADDFLDLMNPDQLAYDYSDAWDWDLAGVDVMRNIVSESIDETKEKVAKMEQYQVKGKAKDEGAER